MRLRIRLFVIVALVLGACTMQPEKIREGMSSAQVGAIMGSATYEVDLPEGLKRRFYRDNVSMVSTWRADFDRNDRLVDFAPATTSFEFAEVTPGTWTRSDVLQRFGLPDRTEVAPRAARTTLIYRYQENGVRPAYMYITLGPKETVVSVEVVPVVVHPSHR